jgi:hypothetical protein
MSRRLYNHQCAVLVCLFLTALPWGSALARLPREKATIEGVYHQDRWGVGRIGELLISPKLHDSLKKHEGKRIRLECLDMRQRSIPGEVLVQRIGEVTPLDDSLLKIEFRSRMGDFPERNNVELTVILTNASQETLELRTNDSIFLRVFWATEVPGGDKEVDWGLPGLTRNQLSAKSQLHHQWDNGRLFDSIADHEHIINLTLKPAGQIALVVRRRVPLKECEARVNVRFSIKDQAKEPQLYSERWFPLTITQFDPKNAKRAEQHFEITDIHSEVHRKSCIRLHFRIKPLGTAKTKLQHIVFENRALPCGQMELLDGDDSIVKAQVEAFGAAANDPQDLRLTPLDAMGIESYLDIYPPSRPGIEQSIANYPIYFDHFRLHLMTENGIETVTATAPKEVRALKGK